MPPRRLKKKSVKRLVEKHVAKAIEEYEKTRANPSNASGSGSTNTGGTVNVQSSATEDFLRVRAYNKVKSGDCAHLKDSFRSLTICPGTRVSSVNERTTLNYCTAAN
ncbi:hypothetical protein Tco_0276097 [Tanacetum coccineum]